MEDKLAVANVNEGDILAFVTSFGQPTLLPCETCEHAECKGQCVLYFDLTNM